MTLVAVAPSMWSEGVSTTGTVSGGCKRHRCGGVHTYDWRAKPGSKENTHRITADYEVMELEDALSRSFTTDAMVVPYVLYLGGEPLKFQPRLCKNGLGWVRELGYTVQVHSLWTDHDNPAHGSWTPDLWTDFEGHWNNAPPLQTIGAYFGSGGWRGIQPVLEGLSPEATESAIAATLRDLERYGMRPDRGCVDWTRNFRLPGARIKGRRYGLGEVRLHRMVAIAPPTTARAVRRGRTATPKTRETVDASGVVYANELPDDWTPARVETLARAVLAVPTVWHPLFLALAGALVVRGVSHDVLPAVVSAVSVAAGDTRTPDRIASALSTVNKVRNREGFAGYTALREQWPGVADAVDVVTSSGAELRLLRQLAAPAPKPLPLSEALAVLDREIEQPYGVTLLSGPPGLGKTRKVIDTARRLPVIHERAAPGARIALSVPRHDLAEQIFAQLPDRTLRLFGPLSHKTDSKPTCIHFDAAAPLVAGGQSLEREFCSGRGRRNEACIVAETCPARAGAQGNLTANLALGPHALGRELSELAGVAGGMFVDELPPLVESQKLSVERIETALRYLDVFTPAYEAAMRPALVALLAWARELGAVTQDGIPLTDALRAGVAAIPTDVLEQSGIDPKTPAVDLADLVLVRAAEAIDADARSKAPPVQWAQIAYARRNPAKAAQIGEASGVLNVLWRAITAKNEPLPKVRIDVIGEERTVVLTRLNDDQIAVLRRQGPTTCIDANAHLYADVYAKVLGFRPRVVQIAVVDGALVDRNILLAPNANRRSWLPRGVPAWDAGLLNALRMLIAWANEEPRATRLAIIAPNVLETAILTVLRPDDPTIAARWKAARMTAQTLDTARSVLAPILGAFAGQILTGHFGAVTGMDHMADCDALATVMDPRPNLSEVYDHATFLGLDPEGRLDQLAAAELQQAHGRLRLIHRTRPARALHIGAIAPNGWQGLPVNIRRLPLGRPRNDAAMTPEEFRGARSTLGVGVREFARTLGISHQTVQRWESGEGPGSAIRADVATAVRALVSSGPETPQRESIYRGFVDRFPSTAPENSGAVSLQGVCGPDAATGDLWTTSEPWQEGQ